jgi:hypothetical protein
MKNLSEKLSWKQIVEKYPDEWVLLDDYEPDVDFDGTGFIATKGRVLVHAKDKREFYRKKKRLLSNISPGWNHAQHYTGDPSTPEQKKLSKIANS